MLAWRIENASRQLSSHSALKAQRSTDALTFVHLESPPQLDELFLRVFVLYLFGDQLEPWTVGRHSTGTECFGEIMSERKLDFAALGLGLQENDKAAGLDLCPGPTC